MINELIHEAYQIQKHFHEAHEIFNPCPSHTYPVEKIRDCRSIILWRQEKLPDLPIEDWPASIYEEWATQSTPYSQLDLAHLFVLKFYLLESIVEPTREKEMLEWSDIISLNQKIWTLGNDIDCVVAGVPRPPDNEIIKLSNPELLDSWPNFFEFGATWLLTHPIDHPDIQKIIEYCYEQDFVLF